MDLVYTMLKYMLDQKSRTNGNLPFAMTLTRLFRHFKVDLKKEKASEVTSYSHIKDSTLKRMRLVKKDGRWVDRQQGQQPVEEQAEEEEHQQEPSTAPQHAEPQSDSVEGQEGFDHFPLDDLLRSSPQPHLSPPITQPSSSRPTPSTSQPTSIDFSPILSYLDSQFSQLNSRVSQLDSKVDLMTTDYSSFKQQVVTQLSEAQTKMDMIELSFAHHCPEILKSLQSILEFQQQHQHSIQTSFNDAIVALKDLRDNSDRICLKYKIPSLAQILKDLSKQLRDEYKASRPPNRPPFTPPSSASPPPKSHKSSTSHKSRSKTYKPRQAKASKSQPSKSSHVPMDISDDSSSSSSLSGSDPYEDKPRSESE